MLKQNLRKKYKDLKTELTQDAVNTLSLNISNNLLKMSIWNHSFYHVFLSIYELKEVDTDPILSVLSGRDKNIVLSKTNFDDCSMVHYLLTDATIIKKNSWNIPEPVDGIEIDAKKIDVVFVPLLAFDKQGNRVGYGKGFYDRFLLECKPDTIKIGLSFFESEDKIKDISSNDVKLDFCVTPKKIYKF